MGYSYKDLIAWQKAMEFSVYVYKLTKDFPDSEKFGITAQLRRAVISIPSNIAEGQGRATKGEFRQFLGIARGSLLEVLTQLEIALALTYVSDSEFSDAEIRGKELLRVLSGLYESMRD